jgi:hypothetical protein
MTHVINYTEFDYTHDRRVQAQDDGTILVTSGVLYSDTDRVLSQENGYWYARGRTTHDCDITDDGDKYHTRLQAFDSAEEAACHIVGAPAELEYDGRYHRMFLSTNDDGTPYIDTDTNRPYTLLVQHRPERPPETAWFAFEGHVDDPHIFVGPTPERAADAYFGIEWSI